jgi:3',5'-cyclic-AMP phosphodiesterase
MPAYSQHPPFDRLIVHISDTHLLAGEQKLYGSIDSGATLRGFLDRLVATEMDVDAFVFTGDLAERGEEAAYERLAEIVKPFATKLDAQVIWVMGNHDERQPFAQSLFGEESSTRPQDRVYDLAGLRVIALDTSVPGYHHGDLTSAQLEWLSAELATPAPMGTLLALHHPPIPSPNEIMGVIELDDQAALEKVVRGTDVRGILAGHLHYSTHALFAGVPVSVCAGACYNVDMLPDASSLLSAVSSGISASLVHVYPDRVVFSQVPFDGGVELATQSATQRDMVAAMSPAERREVLSNKNSDFNKSVDRKQAGG